jgi:hypothetical protein
MGAKSSTEESARNRRSRVDDRVTRQDWVALLSSRVRLCTINPDHGSVARHRQIDERCGHLSKQLWRKTTPRVRSPRSPFLDRVKICFQLDDHSKARCSTLPDTSTAAVLENLREAVRAAIFVARLTLVDKIFPATPGRRAGLRARLP